MISQLLGWLAIPFILYFLWAVSSKRRSAFIGQIIGSLLFAASAFLAATPLWGLVVANLLFGVLAVRAYMKWGAAPSKPPAAPIRKPCKRPYCPHCHPENFYATDPTT